MPTELSKNDRVNRALASGGKMFIGAVFGLFIPFFHFFLVPGFILGGVYVAIQKYKVTHVVDSLDITCPECEKNIHMKEFSTNVLPHLYCPHCQFFLRSRSDS